MNVVNIIVVKIYMRYLYIENVYVFALVRAMLPKARRKFQI